MAAGQLRQLFCSLFPADPIHLSTGLLAVLAQQAHRVGRDDLGSISANGIGFLTQAYEATAGLIGNTLVTLARHRMVRGQVQADPRVLANVVEEVTRYDPPIQNTRRFLVEDETVAGKEMHAGDVVVLVLAAANRDPVANPHPERFESGRTARRSWTFSAGDHACPGERLACTVTQANVTQLLAAGLDVAALAQPVDYYPSVNVRIPRWAPPTDG